MERLAVQGGEPSRRAHLAARPEPNGKGLENIAQADDLIDRLAFEMSEKGIERESVAVNIGKDRDFHGQIR